MRLLKNVARTAALWILVGVPVASVISAVYLLFWVTLAIPRMAATAAVLGIADGLWIHLAAGSRRGSKALDLLINASFGAVLGLLGFPPVFAPTELYVEKDLVVAIFIASGVVAGATSGMVAVKAGPCTSVSRPIARKLAVALLLIAGLATADYHWFLPETMAKLPVHVVSQDEVQSIKGGNALGSAFTGCYSYWGKTKNLGVSSGAFRLVQNDGSIRVTGYLGQWVILSGGVDRTGRFRFGGERIWNGNTARELWKGRFHGSSFQFLRRSTWITKTDASTERLVGYGKRIPCDSSLPAIQ
ncbi:MAG: hypothetical protein JO211_03930 [Acidobacteriaceae bacterium]|nr:hypothetical protein [Acidobacteriaceae bacterium]